VLLKWVVNVPGRRAAAPRNDPVGGIWFESIWSGSATAIGAAP